MRSRWRNDPGGVVNVRANAVRAARARAENSLRCARLSVAARVRPALAGEDGSAARLVVAPASRCVTLRPPAANHREKRFFFDAAFGPE